MKRLSHQLLLDLRLGYMDNLVKNDRYEKLGAMRNHSVRRKENLQMGGFHGL